MPRTILIAAGGTGGHLFPGIAVADELKARDAQTRVVFVGTPRGLESRLVPQAGYELELLPILPLNGVGLVRMLKGLLALPWAMLKAVQLVRPLRRGGVLGVGGCARGPPSWWRRSSGSAPWSRAQCQARVHQPSPQALR